MTYPRSTAISILPESVVGKFATKVYALMGGFLALTAAFSAIAMATGVDRWLIAHPWVFIGLLFLELGLVGAYGGTRRSENIALPLGLVFAYTILNGITFSAVFLSYHVSTIVVTFLLTSGIFGLATVFGFIGRSILQFGHWLLIGVLGLLAAMVVNLFIGSGLMDYVISCLAVVIFTGLAVYDTQMIKERARQNPSNIEALDGALELYLDFVNIFINLLRLIGGSSSSKS